MTAMRTPVLLSVNVGLPRNVPWQGQTVYAGIWKHPVDGPAMVRRLNIDGDGQSDTNGHGGEQVPHGTAAATCTTTRNPARFWTWPHPAATSSWQRHRPEILTTLRGHRRHPGAVHAAPARGGPQRARGLAAARGTRTGEQSASLAAPAQRPVAETVVYLRGPGTVVCCRNCPGMLMVISPIRGVNCADLGGLTALDPRRGD